MVVDEVTDVDHPLSQVIPLFTVAPFDASPIPEGPMGRQRTPLRPLREENARAPNAKGDR